jgi:hypothetical protein
LPTIQSKPRLQWRTRRHASRRVAMVEPGLEHTDDCQNWTERAHYELTEGLYHRTQYRC